MQTVPQGKNNILLQLPVLQHDGEVRRRCKVDWVVIETTGIMQLGQETANQIPTILSEPISVM